ncbi:hypothetical protein SAMN04488503_3123 [Humidesulfovibrio mexicanus]|uniref:Uncharacterized protein n=1 Tax=Humidesulfovibrio mexicanus TaxID=147047 RepID=A0A239CI88_9BACT|nr:hypothetical protein [Humidesulfovibrio mexicanus]SNS19398.1 hypothetical protein SAMN04488503_3123 [Humidesulfovibrio mexicanus]
MSIVKKNSKLGKQVNIKITGQAHDRYQKVKNACRLKGWDFSLQPEFTEWLNAQLVSAEKELSAAEKAEAKQASQSDVSA